MGINIGRLSKETLIPACMSVLASGMVLAGCQKESQPGQGISIIPKVSSEVTKGTIVTTDEINSKDYQFMLQGYLDDDIKDATGEKILDSDKSDYHFIKNGLIVHNGSQWDWADVPATGTDEDKDAARPKWRNDIPSRFWSYYPADMEAIVTDLELPGKTPSDDEQKKVTFSYTQPSPDTLEPYQDAENQEDILFAFNEKKYTSTSTQTLEITFSHALSAIVFDITKLGNTVDFGTEISLVNVKYSGDCTVDGLEGDKVQYTWDNLSSDTRTFSQSFDKDQDFETVGTAPDQYIKQKKEGAKTFFMIPQVLTSDTKLRIAFIFKEGGLPIRREVSIGKWDPSDTVFAEWEAGKIYTYQIKVSDDYTLLDAKLAVKDWVDDSQEVSF